MIVTELRASKEDFAARTGWIAKPEGLCKGAMCVPLPASGSDGASLDLAVVAERLGMPVLHDETHGVWALGPATVSGRALDTAEAPDLTLPDLEGRPFELASLRGQRVVVFSWASW